MTNQDLKAVTTAEEAREFAIDWQNWFSERSMSMFDLAMWQADLRELAEKFGLVDEFQENGII